MRSWSKWKIFSRRWKSSSNVGPHRPARSEFWSSATATPCRVVSTGRPPSAVWWVSPPSPRATGPSPRSTVSCASLIRSLLHIVAWRAPYPEPGRETATVRRPPPDGRRWTRPPRPGRLPRRVAGSLRSYPEPLPEHCASARTRGDAHGPTGRHRQGRGPDERCGRPRCRGTGPRATPPIPEVGQSGVRSDVTSTRRWWSDECRGPARDRAPATTATESDAESLRASIDDAGPTWRRRPGAAGEGGRERSRRHEGPRCRRVCQHAAADAVAQAQEAAREATDRAQDVASRAVDRAVGSARPGRPTDRPGNARPPSGPGRRRRRPPRVRPAPAAPVTANGAGVSGVVR